MSLHLRPKLWINEKGTKICHCWRHLRRPLVPAIVMKNTGGGPAIKREREKGEEMRESSRKKKEERETWEQLML
jgi:hypothetical protein